MLQSTIKHLTTITVKENGRLRSSSSMTFYRRTSDTASSCGRKKYKGCDIKVVTLEKNLGKRCSQAWDALCGWQAIAHG